jgi:hypothetical protein
MKGNEAQSVHGWFSVITQITLDYKKKSKEPITVLGIDDIESDVVILLQSQQESLNAKKESLRF